MNGGDGRNDSARERGERDFLSSGAPTWYGGKCCPDFSQAVEVLILHFSLSKTEVSLVTRVLNKIWSLLSPAILVLSLSLVMNISSVPLGRQPTCLQCV